MLTYHFSNPTLILPPPSRIATAGDAMNRSRVHVSRHGSIDIGSAKLPTPPPSRYRHSQQPYRAVPLAPPAPPTLPTPARLVTLTPYDRRRAAAAPSRILLNDDNDAYNRRRAAPASSASAFNDDDAQLRSPVHRALLESATNNINRTMVELYTEFGLSPPPRSGGAERSSGGGRSRSRTRARTSPPAQYLAAVDAEVARRAGVRLSRSPPPLTRLNPRVVDMSVAPVPEQERWVAALPSEQQRRPSPQAMTTQNPLLSSRVDASPVAVAPAAIALPYTDRAAFREWRVPLQAGAALEGGDACGGEGKEEVAPQRVTLFQRPKVEEVNLRLKAKNEELIAQLREFRGQMGAIFRQMKAEGAQAIDSAVAAANESAQESLRDEVNTARAEAAASLNAAGTARSEAARAADAAADARAATRCAREAAEARTEENRTLLGRVREQSSLLIELASQTRALQSSAAVGTERWREEAQKLSAALDEKSRETEVLRAALDRSVAEQQLLQEDRDRERDRRADEGGEDGDEVFNVWGEMESEERLEQKKTLVTHREPAAAPVRSSRMPTPLTPSPPSVVDINAAVSKALAEQAAVHDAAIATLERRSRDFTQYTVRAEAKAASAEAAASLLTMHHTALTSRSNKEAASKLAAALAKQRELHDRSAARSVSDALERQRLEHAKSMADAMKQVAAELSDSRSAALPPPLDNAANDIAIANAVKLALADQASAAATAAAAAPPVLLLANQAAINDVAIAKAVELALVDQAAALSAVVESAQQEGRAQLATLETSHALALSTAVGAARREEAAYAAARQIKTQKDIVALSENHSAQLASSEAATAAAVEEAVAAALAVQKTALTAESSSAALDAAAEARANFQAAAETAAKFHATQEELQRANARIEGLSSSLAAAESSSTESLAALEAVSVARDGVEVRAAEHVAALETLSAGHATALNSIAEYKALLSTHEATMAAQAVEHGELQKLYSALHAKIGKLDAQNAPKAKRTSLLRGSGSKKKKKKGAHRRLSLHSGMSPLRLPAEEIKIVSGNLLKKRSTGKKYDIRYFTTTSHYLMYKTKEGSKTLSGGCDLLGHDSVILLLDTDTIVVRGLDADHEPVIFVFLIYCMTEYLANIMILYNDYYRHAGDDAEA